MTKETDCEREEARAKERRRSWSLGKERVRNVFFRCETHEWRVCMRATDGLLVCGFGRTVGKQKKEERRLRKEVRKRTEKGEHEAI